MTKISPDCFFSKKSGLSVFEKKHGLIINKFQIFNRLKCLNNCEINQQCQYASFNSSVCVLYSFYAKYYLQNGSNGFLFEKENHKNFGLINYWPIENGQARDLVGSKDLYDSYNTVYSQDRHGSNNSALNFSGGFIRAPSGVYFSNEFTVLAWVKLKSHASWQRLFDFGNGPRNDNVLVGLSCRDNYLCFHLYNNNTNLAQRSTSLLLDLNVWYHFGFSLKTRLYMIYVNGILAEFNYTVTDPINVVERISNYFGKSNWQSNSNGDFYCDEIKFFNIKLSDSEIRNEFFYDFH